MQARALAVEGAYEFTPRVHSDARGLFVSPFQESGFAQTTRHRLFPVAQTNHSMSRRGTVRGIHFTVTPPGAAKYVYCARGAALDIVIDIRVGSPTFGRWDAVRLDTVDFRAMYFPIGVGHAFVALEDSTVMSYMLSGEYVAANELAVSAFDPAVGLPIPDDIEPILSERDQAAGSLAQAASAGVLPRYDASLEIERALWRG